jgi:polysaccharide biosynthesis/export protein
MRRRPWSGRAGLRFGAVLLAMIASGPSLLPPSVAQSPTPDQMEVFRNLPPEQQEAILERLGGDQAGTQRDRDLASPETVRPRTADDTAERLPGTDDREIDWRTREPRIRGNDTVLIDLALKPADTSGRERTQEEKLRLEGFLERMQRGNPYRLDANGQLRIPGVAPIALAGLTEKQAAERLNRDPVLRDFVAKLTLLPLTRFDAEALQPFGYDLFAGVPSTFAPVTDVPVPAEYVVGPGDRLEVQLIGNTRGRHSLTVNRDGRVMFPELGPIVVAGLTFDDARTRIEDRVREQMIGTQVTVTMGGLRSIRVFVLGEAERPGSYTVSGLATITNALFASGGVKKIGSLRNVQLKRDGRLVTRLDLYDLLLNGDTSNDVRLQPGDVIFIPPVGKTVGVTGEIRRPAIYEISGDGTVAELIHLGGGLTPEADPKLASLERIDERRDRIVMDVDLGNPQQRGSALRTGDLLRIPAARPSLANAIHLEGNVYRPGVFQHRSGLRLTDVIPSADELKANSDLGYVLIRRELPGTRRVQVLSADLQQAWRAPTSTANPMLAPRDRIIVFNLETGREQYIRPIVEELRRQATRDEPSQIVTVSGPVRATGEYPLEPGMTISDLIRAAGGLAEQAFEGDAELARYEVRGGETRQVAVTKVDLAALRAGDPAADVPLAPFDILAIRSIAEWSQQDVIRLEGEVRFPGQYPIERGETLRSVIARAGGLTQLAFPEGSVFTRETLKERERQQLRTLADRLRQDLASLALQTSQSGGEAGDRATETLQLGQTLLADLQNAQPVGRLVIDFDKVAGNSGGDELVLKSGDRLKIPQRSQEVTVIGEVQNATSHLFDPSLSRDDYVSLSGGTTRRADSARIYIVRANGSVETGGGSRWFRGASEIRPGDTIVVPLDAERMRPLPLWTAVTTILFNLAVAVAAVNSF